MVDKKLKLGIVLQTPGLLTLTPERPADVGSLISITERVEDAGLDSVWAGDYLISRPMQEPLTTLAAVAARTHRVRLGTSVLLAVRHHPVLLAYTVGTLDLISGGRTVLGIGIGEGSREEKRAKWQAAGIDPSTRVGRVEELVQIIKGLTAGEEGHLPGASLPARVGAR